MFGINNPQALLQPWKNLAHFSEELYAMMVSRKPIEREGPVTISVKPGQTALKLVRDDPVDSPTLATPRRPTAPEPEPRAIPGRAQPTPGREPARTPLGATPASEAPARKPPPASPAEGGPYQQVPGRRASRAQDGGRPDPGRRRDSQVATPRKPEPGRAERSPLLEVGGHAKFSGPEAVHFDVPPKVYDFKRKEYFTPPAFAFPDTNNMPFIGGGGGATTFMGKVVSHSSGSPAIVDLYPDGPDAASDPDGPFSVTIPVLADGDKLPPEMVLSPIFQFQDADGNDIYYYQPPIWMA